MFFFALLVYSYAEADKPLAADLVEDGQKIDIAASKYQQLFTELIDQHGFSQEQLTRLFDDVRIHRRVLELMDKQWEAKPYYQYRKLFITPWVIAKGKLNLHKYKDILDKVEREFKVDREVVVAIWGIETKFGSHTGSYNVFRSLNTLFDAYPRRSAFFRKQLVHFLLLCRENGVEPLEVNGSYAGAFGQTQFIPSSFREYAVSFDGDDKRDVFSSTDDILASIANYLHRHHYVLGTPVYRDIGNELHDSALIKAELNGRNGRVDHDAVAAAQKVDIPPPPDNKQLSIVGLEQDPKEGGGYRFVAGYPNFHAITAWNHSNRYAMAVAELAEALK